MLKNKIVIIIVSYNGKEYWPDLMPTLLEEKYQDVDVEILVVDNHSDDGSAADLARTYPGVKIIRNEENLGFVGGNNVGYEYAKKNKADLQRCSEDILLARETHFPKTIADLYKPDEIPDNLKQAHEKNDETLERIYIGRRFKNDTERLEKLFKMYTEMTTTEEKSFG